LHSDNFYRQLVVWPWFAWAMYWLVSAALTKTTERREPLASRLSHVLPLMLGGLLLGWPKAPWEWLTLRLWPRAAVPYAVGLTLLYAGLAFAVWARVHLGRNWSGTVTVKQGHELIRSGPYGYVRHPIYTGLVSAVLGTALASGTVRAALGFLIITAAFLLKLRTEERFMRETFPAQYPAYCEQVPALVPFTKPRRSAPR
jgi:protein-S-isoprenylcysteine O-methyltransferase Ste14